MENIILIINMFINYLFSRKDFHIIKIMGSNQGYFSSNHCHLYLSTDKPYYNPGETITGNIYLRQLSPFNIYCLDLRIRGTEKVHWEVEVANKQNNNNQNDNKPFHTVTFKDRNEIYNHHNPIFNFPSNSILPGDYCFPFQFMLGDFCPGTFDFNWQKNKAKIKYTLTAFLRPTFKYEKSKDLRYKQMLVVRQKPKFVNANQFVNRSTKISNCCAGKGISEVKCQFERDGYVPGETANLLCWVDNTHCDTDMHTIRVGLSQTVEMRKHSQMETFRQTFPVSKIETKGVLAHDKTNDPLHLQLHLQRQNPNDRMLMHLQGPIEPTVHGSLVTNTFDLSVEPFYVGCGTNCCAKPTVNLPLYIFAPELPTFGKVSAPSNWKPQMMNACNIIVSKFAEVTNAINMVANAVSMPNVSLNVSASPPLISQPPPVHAQANFNMGLPSVNMTVSENANMGGNVNMQMNLGGPGVSISANEYPNNQANINMNMNMGMPNISVNVDDYQRNQANANLNMNMNMGGPNISVNVDDYQRNQANANLNMNMGMPNINMEIKESSSSNQANLNMNMGMGMGMPGMNINVSSNGPNF